MKHFNTTKQFTNYHGLIINEHVRPTAHDTGYYIILSDEFTIRLEYGYVDGSTLAFAKNNYTNKKETFENTGIRKTLTALATFILDYRLPTQRMKKETNDSLIIDFVEENNLTLHEKTAMQSINDFGIYTIINNNINIVIKYGKTGIYTNEKTLVYITDNQTGQIRQIEGLTIEEVLPEILITINDFNTRLSKEDLKTNALELNLLNKGVLFTDNITEGIYILPNGKIVSGDFEYGGRNVDHRIMELVSPYNRYDNEFWGNVMNDNSLIMVVPETSTFLHTETIHISNQQLELIYELQNNGFSFQPFK